MTIQANRFLHFDNPCLIGIRKIEKLQLFKCRSEYFGKTFGCRILVKRRPSQITVQAYLCVFVCTILLVLVHVLLVPIV